MEISKTEKVVLEASLDLASKQFDKLAENLWIIYGVKIDHGDLYFALNDLRIKVGNQEPTL